jgi:hypothetical protein
MLDINTYYQDIETGEFQNFSNSEYYCIKALNSSSLKFGEKSPLHTDLALQGKLKSVKKEFDYGSEFHYMLFEPETFNSEYYISDKHLGNKLKTDISQKAYEKLMVGAGKSRIDAREGEKMKRSMESLSKHPSIRNLIEQKGTIETTLIWKDSFTGLNCKCKVDKLIHNDFIIDLKTTKDASKHHFTKDFKNYNYAIQAAFYLDGYKTIFGEDKKIEFVFIAIDKEEPYLCELYELSEKTLNEAREKYRKYMMNWIEYKNNPDVLYIPKTL